MSYAEPGWPDAMDWSPRARPAQAETRQGRAPAMTYMAWWRSYGTDIGGTARTEWYWRCPARDCRRYSGPYPDAKAAQLEGIDHQRLGHPKREKARQDRREAVASRTRGRSR